MLTKPNEENDDDKILVSIDYEKLYRMKSQVLERVVATGRNYIDNLLKDLSKNNPGLKISGEVDQDLDSYREAYNDMKDFQEMVKMAEMEVEAQHAVKH